MIISQILSDETEHIVDWTGENLINYDNMRRGKKNENFLVMNTKSGLSTTLKNNFKKISAV